MEEHELLVRHTETWARTKSRDLRTELLHEVLSLRENYDALPYGTWPKGSAERLLLTTWPAYGKELPDLDDLMVTLDTFWSFLRATGRMSAQSAPLSELRKEAKRTLPKMGAAYDDPARHSTGRVLGDFGESIGISLEGADTLQDMQARLGAIQDAWNALPQEERVRRMPDTSPKSRRAAKFTAMTTHQDAPDDDFDDVPALTGSDPALSARDARESAYVQTCLELATWVGEGRPATERGLLRPAVAREAYQHLGLWSWDRALDQLVFDEDLPPVGSDADAELARGALESWRSAGNCLALDRYWFSLEGTQLIERAGARVRASNDLPQDDQEWVHTAVTLLIGLCRRLGEHPREPLPGILLLPHVNDGTASLDEIAEWWESRCPARFRGIPEVGWGERLDLTLFHFDDCNLWTRTDDRLTLTHLGRDFALVYLNMVDEGLLDDE